jgi:hypothetical protein
MGKLNLLRAFLERYPKLSNVGITTDFLTPRIGAACLEISGDSVTSETSDVLGNKFRDFSFTAVLYIKFTTAAEIMRIRNVLNFEELENWIHDNENLLPPFGNYDTELETLRAENAVLFDAGKNGEAGVYQIQLTRSYTKIY